MTAMISTITSAFPTPRPTVLEDFIGKPLPELFSSHFFDMPFLHRDEYVMEDASCESSQSGTIVEEILDFFVDPSNPSRMLMSRAAVPDSQAAAQSVAVQQPPLLPVPSMRSKAAQPATAPRRRIEENVEMKRERNRLAAERCRAKRSNLISALQSEVEALRADRERLQQENKILLDAFARSGVKLPDQYFCPWS
ncbi:hypothetical protein PSACC_01810 [Paramicrosporidium saccamoebae]|uniref:BZIP domain-containing protein n=1 Tax=Paramicrosporidium saccamoebae TaxID=1246581 RepID=A0A2H9TKU1_9FUNG|nr:hypothetical protein PSACC_01810 [Paramicrosporidium saccamoebae]